MNPLIRRPRAVTAAAAMACAAVSLVAPSATLAAVSATSQNTALAGTVTDTLVITPTPAATLSPLSPGSTATANGTVTVTSTSTGNWVLSVNDQNTGANAGQPAAAAAGCTNSAAYLPTLGVTATGTNVTSSGLVPLSGTATQIATGPSSAGSVSTAFQDIIPASTRLAAGCTYTLTSVFTASAP